jgi:hypothetical protein
MQLQHLDFEFSDEDSGEGSFDAMASVLPARLPALLAEVTAVLRWASRGFGAPQALDDGGDWDYQLEALEEPDQALEVRFDAARGEVALAPAAGAGRVTVTLTLGGSAAFCAALRQAFSLEA